MIAPRIHLNGTAKKDLMEGQLYPAVKAIGDAIAALHNAAPNARDYYVIGPDAYRQARGEFVTRLRSLEAVHAELLGMYEAIDDNQIQFDVTPVATEQD